MQLVRNFKSGFQWAGHVRQHDLGGDVDNVINLITW